MYIVNKLGVTEMDIGSDSVRLMALSVAKELFNLGDVVVITE